jgi:hypothetical protein
MRRLHYATVTTDAHAVVVTTWQEAKAKGSRQYVDHYRMAIDGRTLDEGTLELENRPIPCSAWDSCPNPDHKHNRPHLDDQADQAKT